jgi:hypothetical protein
MEFAHIAANSQILEYFNVYLTASKLKAEDQAEVAKATFLLLIGRDTYEIWKTLRKEDDSDSLKDAQDKLTKHFVPKKSVFTEKVYTILIDDFYACFLLRLK